MVVTPRYIADPYPCIHRGLSRLLLRYSKHLGWTPLALCVVGATPRGRVLEDGGVAVNILTEMAVVRLRPGDTAHSESGLFLGAFPCTVDTDEHYTGDFTVKTIDADGAMTGTTVEEDAF